MPTVTAEGAELPIAVLPGSPLGRDGKTLPSVGQTWDWPDAADIVPQCTASVLVTELGRPAGSTVAATREDRARALLAVAVAVAQATTPAAVSWPHSQRVSDPGALETDDLQGLANVRMYAVSDDALVVDTLGLHVFGLPDLQCHFRDRSAGEVAALLFSTAEYLFDEGDVIADGDTIGAGAAERFTCYHEQSLLPPTRTVLDVDLGDPYAAGRRDR